MLNRNTIKELGCEKFVSAVTGIIGGYFLYKTNDGRILDFRAGTETVDYLFNLKTVGSFLK